MMTPCSDTTPRFATWVEIEYGGNGYPVRKGLVIESNLPWKLAPVRRPEGLLSLGGCVYELRVRHGRLLFCRKTEEAGEWLYYVSGNQDEAENYESIKDSEPEHLAEVIERRQYGRCLIFRPGGKYWKEIVFLFLKADGTGFYADDQDEIAFSWQTEHLGLSRHADVLDMPVSGNELGWETFTQSLLSQQVEPKMGNPFVTPDGFKARRSRFISGSRRELEQVTRWAIQSDPALCDPHDPDHVHVAYEAKGETCGGVNDIDAQGGVSNQRRLKELCELAFAHNTFVGTRWHHQGYGSRLSDWKEYPRIISVTTNPPSAHEQAEALLELSEWLQGKVSPQKRRALLKPPIPRR